MKPLRFGFWPAAALLTGVLAVPAVVGWWAYGSPVDAAIAATAAAWAFDRLTL